MLPGFSFLLPYQYSGKTACSSRKVLHFYLTYTQFLLLNVNFKKEKYIINSKNFSKGGSKSWICACG